MKKFLVIILAAGLLSLASVACAAQYLGPTVTGMHVNVRKAPNMNAKVLYQLDKGNGFIVKSIHQNPGEKYPWYKVDINIEEGVGEENGWIYGQFMQIPQRKINGTRVNMRKNASKTAPVAYCFQGYENVAVTGVLLFDANNGEPSCWYKVSYKGKEGWVYEQYIR